MPTHARINSTNQDGAVHVKLNTIPKSLELARSVGRGEQIVVLLVTPAANGHCRAQHDPQGLQLRRDSIDHHTAVRVAQNIVLEPPGQSVQSHTTKVTSWDARLGILKEICSELPCGVRIQWTLAVARDT